VSYGSGAPFYAGTPDRTTLRLCFVTQTPKEIGEGLRRLGKGVRAASAGA
jgi:2-aminoadipate transaminase